MERFVCQGSLVRSSVQQFPLSSPRRLFTHRWMASKPVIMSTDWVYMLNNENTQKAIITHDQITGVLFFGTSARLSMLRHNFHCFFYVEKIGETLTLEEMHGSYWEYICSNLITWTVELKARLSCHSLIQCSRGVTVSYTFSMQHKQSCSTASSNSVSEPLNHHVSINSCKKFSNDKTEKS